MALRLNLYHEVLRAKRQKQYDPLKISFLALLLLGIGMVGYYVVRYSGSSNAQAASKAKQAEFDRLSPLAKTARDRELELTKKIDLADRVSQKIEKRFYWAPVFESLVAAVPASVQITKLSGETKAGDGARTCSVVIEGMAASQEPRATAEDLRRLVVERTGAKYPTASATFRNLDDGEPMRVRGENLATAVFTIQLTFKPDAEPVPAPKAIVERTRKPIASTH